MSVLRLALATAAVLLPAIGAQAAAVSANFASDASSMGTGDAGFIPAANWNNIPGNDVGGGVSVSNLNDNSGAATTLDLSISQSHTAGGTTPAFADPDNNAMYGGHSWISGQPIIVTATQIPYAQYDVYVYFRSGQIGTDHTQLFTIDNTLNNTVLFSQEGKEAWPNNGPSQSTFVQSTGSTAGNDLTAGNYVKFSNVNLSAFHLNLSVEQTYTYLNGMQIVQTPEPTTFVMAALGAVGLFAVARRRRRAA